MRRNLRRLIISIAVALAIVAVALALRPKPVSVDLAAVDRGHLQVTIEEDGETRCRQRFVVSAPVAGQVLRLALEPGDAVVAGETVLATFQPAAPNPLDARARAEAEADVKAARSAVGQAEAERSRLREELGLAARELERVRRLASSDIVSGDQLDVAEVQHRLLERSTTAASYGVTTARHHLESAEAKLLDGGATSRLGPGPIVIRSPIDGYVLKRFRESESVVPAGEPLLEVADPRDLEIVADLLSSQAVKVRSGQRVLIERWGGDGELTGTVGRIEPSGFTKVSALGVEEQRVNVLIDLHEPPHTGDVLGDGYRVAVRIVIWEEPDVLRIPTSSLFRLSGGWGAFVAVDGHARLHEVRLGRRNAIEAQVLSGVEEGMEVIVHPSDAVAGGTRVIERGT